MSASSCEACGGAARYIDPRTGKCSTCGHVQGAPIDRRIWLGPMSESNASWR
jgi:hypothetical protein